MKEYALVSGVFVGPVGVTLSEAKERIECVWDGIVDDRHHGRTKPAGGREPYVPRGTELLNIRQVSIVSETELAEIALRMGVPEVTGPDLGANLVMKNIERITKLPGGTTIKFPARETLLCVIGKNAPCGLPGKNIQARYPHIPQLAKKFREQAVGLRGLVAVVLRPGYICQGDTVEIIL
ncbi:MAG: hypothetical protein WAP23_04205 [Candidatus Spechtbacterales bacterium]